MIQTRKTFSLYNILYSTEKIPQLKKKLVLED